MAYLKMITVINIVLFYSILTIFLTIIIADYLDKDLDLILDDKYAPIYLLLIIFLSFATYILI